jgi:hypothetical protein
MGLVLLVRLQVGCVAVPPGCVAEVAVRMFNLSSRAKEGLAWDDVSLIKLCDYVGAAAV